MSVVDEPRTKRRYIHRAQARGMLINATINLLRELPFSEVTTRRIACEADLNLVAIQTNFGSQMGLMVAVAAELADRVAVALHEAPPARSSRSSPPIPMSICALASWPGCSGTGWSRASCKRVRVRRWPPRWPGAWGTRANSILR